MSMSHGATAHKGVSGLLVARHLQRKTPSMGPKFTTRHLTPDRIAVAFPLARMAMGMALDEWIAYAKTLTEPRAGDQGRPGIVCLSGPDDTIYAMFAYRPVNEPRYGPTLYCEYVATLDLVHGEAVRSAIEQAMEIEARAKGCGTILVRVPADSDAMPVPVLGPLQALHARGYDIGAVEMCRPVSVKEDD